MLQVWRRMFAPLHVGFVARTAMYMPTHRFLSLRTAVLSLLMRRPIVWYNALFLTVVASFVTHLLCRYFLLCALARQALYLWHDKTTGVAYASLAILVVPFLCPFLVNAAPAD